MRRTRELAPELPGGGQHPDRLRTRSSGGSRRPRVIVQQPVLGIPRRRRCALLEAYRDRRTGSLLAEAARGARRAPDRRRLRDHLAYAVDLRAARRARPRHRPPRAHGRSSAPATPSSSASIRTARTVAASTPRFKRADQAGGYAHGFSTAYSVDMIGAGTPAVAARRTTAPCSASTSIRFPCDRSISSDDRIVPGMRST